MGQKVTKTKVIKTRTRKDGKSKGTKTKRR